jgi:hypothetical protein
MRRAGPITRGVYLGGRPALTLPGRPRIIGPGPPAARRGGACRRERAQRVDRELLLECADWIAEQMLDEGHLIDGALVQIIIEKELAAPWRLPAISHAAAAAYLVAALEADGIAGMPDAVSARLVQTVLEWEDEFLALAGRPRERGGWHMQMTAHE